MTCHFTFPAMAGPNGFCLLFPCQALAGTKRFVFYLQFTIILSRLFHIYIRFIFVPYQDQSMEGFPSLQPAKNTDLAEYCIGHSVNVVAPLATQVH